MSKKLIIGLGTGRCGTDSLSNLLSEQPGVSVTHERKPVLPWRFDPEALEHKLSQIMAGEGPFVGDVALYYLPYVEEILARHPGTRFVSLKRDRADTVRSYLKWVPNHNHWMRHDGTVWQLNFWDFCYPKYEVGSREEAIGCFWDEYYRGVDVLRSRHPDSFALFNLDDLNSVDGVRRILEFCGLEEIKISVGVRTNLGPKDPLPVMDPPRKRLSRRIRNSLRVPWLGSR